MEYLTIQIQLDVASDKDARELLNLLLDVPEVIATRITPDRDGYLEAIEKASKSHRVEIVNEGGVHAAMREFGCKLTQKQGQGPWRRVNPPMCGEVNGLPDLRGFIHATNGVIAILVRPADGRWTEVHLDEFECDDLNDQMEIVKIEKEESERAEKAEVEGSTISKRLKIDYV